MDCRVITAKTRFALLPAMTNVVRKMPARLFLSSGDLVADRRFEFARDLQLKGDLVAAADLLLQATELAPNFASAWFTLGEIRIELGQHDAAVAAFQKARSADPDDRHGASLHLMRLGAEQVSAMPQAYVQALFDQYAPRFEQALVDDLGYRGPSLLFKAVVSVRAAARKPAFFKRAIDLGCGTGLAAAAFAKEVDYFTGFDLSPKMIERARATSLYAELEVADMVQGLRGQHDSSANLILAADAMVYLSDLAPVLSEARRVLAAGGLLAFTVETHAGDGVIIGAGLRYAHGASHVRSAIAAAGLALAHLEDLSARNEDNAPVPGLVVVASRADPDRWYPRRSGLDGLPVWPCRCLTYPNHRPRRPCCRTAFAAGSRAAAGRRASISLRCSKRPATTAPRC
jgi:predicted TPR repeat methyltransferase